MDSTHNCTGTMIFFSQVTHNAIKRFALTVPVLGSITISLEILLVANLVSQLILQNSVNLGKKAVSITDGRHNSKKLVSNSGCCSEPIGMVALNVTSHSLSQSSVRTKPLSRWLLTPLNLL